MSENVKTRRSEKINVRNDLFSTLPGSEITHDETIDHLNAGLSNLNLNDQPPTAELQDEAAALPIPTARIQPVRIL